MNIFFVFCVFHVYFLSLHVKSNEEVVASFFRSALQCIESLQREDLNHVIQTRLYRQLDDYSRTVSAFISAVSRYDPSNRDVINILESLYMCFQNLLIEYATRQGSTDVTTFFTPPTTLNRLPGRPRYAIEAEQIAHCVSIGMTWQRIASCFGISSRTLYRHRQTLGIETLSYALLSNEELDSIVTSILRNTPNAGETYILGSLRSRGIRIQRWRVRQSLRQVDPIGRSLRRRHAIHRRTYCVQGPNQLWLAWNTFSLLTDN